MKPILWTILLICGNSLFAQNQDNCEQLGIEFMGIINTEGTKKLSFEVSNMVYEGQLYYYPGLVLLNEKGDTIAMEDVDYYGIGPNFQTHLLDLRDEISFPFKGELLLFGSYYQRLFCRFEFEIPNAEILTPPPSEPTSSIMVATNVGESHLLIDLSQFADNAPAVEYFISVTNELGNIVYDTHTDLSFLAIPVTELAGKGHFYISVWDNQRKRLLPVQVVEL